MSGLACVSSRSVRLVLLVVVAIAVPVAMGTEAHAAPLPSGALGVDLLHGILARLVQEVGDLVMRIQDEFAGWTIA